MKHSRFCQSCSMPLDPGSGLWGTEKDGSLSTDYCRSCYINGKFTKPEMTLARMRSFIIRKMDEDKIPVDIIEAAVLRLPLLKRWKKKPGQRKKETVQTITGISNEKHPLEEPPVPEAMVISEEMLDEIPEDEQETPEYEIPEPGEGP